jgi:hypothetical protein
MNLFVGFFQEKILAKRRRRRGGGYEYYIKWVGYDDSANEWIPASSLNCPDRLAEFRLEESRKRKRSQRERSHSQKRRSNNKRLKKRRVKIINNDDDEDEEEEENKDEEPTKSVESTNSSSTTSEKNKNPTSIVYGVEKGYKVQAVLGINRTKSEQLHYLVHYKSPTIFEDNMELIPSHIAKKYCEDEIIQFYETRIAWNDQQDD